MAKTPPRLTTVALAKLLGVHVRKIGSWLEQGLPCERRRGKANLFDETTVRAWLAARAAGPSPGAPVEDFSTTRARKESAQAALLEQLHAARQRDLVPADEVRRIWSGEVAAVRALILAAYATAADRIHRAGVLEGVAGVEAALLELGEAICRELADPDRPIAPAPRARADDDGARQVATQ